MRFRLVALALAAGLACAAAAQAQVIGYNIHTGDLWVDTRLAEINDYGYRYRDPFFDEIHGYYGVPRPIVVDWIERDRYAPADVYYGCAIAYALGRPCVEIIDVWARDRGQGWGAVAKRYGIKPGSPAFHAMKRGFVPTYRRWGHPIAVDEVVHVDWSRRDPDKWQPERWRSPPEATGGPTVTKATRSDRGSPAATDKGKGHDKGKGKGPKK